ncbi:hypothetical protein CAPTEDRAFT_223153 [Capitella teleta]|uniref:ribonuclease III n=1 Tax=Capitella teleta TaxID=283909 RepID=R7V2Z3_CAPTE|nr:hypothetical protein CAPTEDRAFT_223153 [Capitella teleta]|eukprot:ELU12939.1 hypothetical protein CAPTEDRAFT_223153 [Capitella teleta]
MKNLRQDQIHSNMFTPRTYQVALLENALKHNTIVCLASRKTFIAVMLIKELAHQVRQPLQLGGKRTLFLVYSDDDVEAQVKVLGLHTDLSVGECCADSTVAQWQEEFVKHQVLVISAQVFVEILLQGAAQISQTNLLIFDDCQHAIEDPAYEKIMQFYTDQTNGQRPRILGLTTSILSEQISCPIALEKTLATLEKVLHSTVETSSDIINIDLYGNKPQESVIECVAYDDPTGLVAEFSTILDSCMAFLDDCNIAFEEKDPRAIPKTVVTECQIILRELGPWCAGKVAHIFLKQLSKLLEHETEKMCRMFMQYIFTQLTIIHSTVENVYDNQILCLEEFLQLMSPRIIQLIKILHNYKPDDNFVIMGNDNFMDAIYDSEGSTDISDEENSEPKPQQVHSTTSNLSKRAVTHHRRQDNPEDESLCGVVFVERRHTAFVLNKLIVELCNWDTDLFFVQSHHICGGAAGPTNNSSQQTPLYKKQEEILKRFRQKDLNLLVSTSVLEEGIDFPKCNLVVKFDAPTSYRSYVQSKARARALKSKYYILTEPTNQGPFHTTLSTYKGIENILISKCLQSRENPLRDDDDASLPDNFMPVYVSPGGAKVTMSSAIALVNRYCGKLPSDAFTHLTPKCQVQAINEADQETWRATLQLPINSPIKRPIYGEAMPSRKLAMMAVALKTCEILHQQGELDDHLLPIGKEMIKYEDEENEWEDHETQGHARPGTTKRKQYYLKKTASTLLGQPQPNEPCHLYIFDTRLTCPITEEQNTRGRKIHAPEDSARGFGIITVRKIPLVPHFPVFTRSGEVTVSIDPVDSEFTFTAEQLPQICHFHRFIFTRVLRLEKDPMVFDPKKAMSSYFIVPLLKDADGIRVDWDFVGEIQKSPLHLTRRKYLPDAKKEAFVFNEDDFHDAVVMPSYRNIDQPQYFYVAEIRKDLNPKCPFPSPELYDTFELYYKSKYGLGITNLDQPLLDVDHTSARLNLLTPRYMNQKGVALPTSSAETRRARRENLQQKQILIPELCDIHPFPASLWRKAVCIPAILYRMNYLLVAEEMRLMISTAAHIGVPQVPVDFRFSELEFGFSTKPGDGMTKEEALESKLSRMKIRDEANGNLTDTTHRIKFDEEFDLVNFIGPSPCLILQTLTMSNANDFFNLERLETIGDSFLKFAITVYLYCEYPGIHEGKLSYLRSKQVSNYNLYKLGKKKGLPDCMVAVKFEPTENWLPPGYVIRKEGAYKGLNVRIASIPAPLLAPAFNESGSKKEEQLPDGQMEKFTKELEECTKAEDEKLKGSDIPHMLIPYNLQTQHSLPDKSIADGVEALIGCYLVTCGQRAALQFMSWLGLRVLPNVKPADKNNLAMSGFSCLPPPPSPLLTHVSNSEDVLKHLLDGYEEFEEKICYKFRDRSYLLQAFTHASYHYNTVTDCYQRLEFLGDAILDYVITRHLFEDSEKHSPGVLTDLRSALVNNNIFAALAVKWNFHKYFRAISPQLFYVIDKFVTWQKDRNDEINLDEEFGELEEDGEGTEEDIEIPKALGDIFESVAGAIYLDSGMSLDTVWQVYYRMMKPQIDAFTERIPKSPVRELLEMEPETAKFEKPERTMDGKIRVTVNVVGKGNFRGIGRNYRIAKSAAAKRALKHIKSIHQFHHHHASIMPPPHLM